MPFGALNLGPSNGNKVCCYIQYLYLEPHDTSGTSKKGLEMNQMNLGPVRDQSSGVDPNPI